MTGAIAAVAALAAGAGGLYFEDGIRLLLSAGRTGHREAPSQPTSTPAPPTADSLTVIGRWEDRIGSSWMQEIRIVEYAGHVVRDTILPDGSVDRDILTEVAPLATERRRFENPSSTFGRVYAITNRGHLAIFDDGGFVHQVSMRDLPGEQQ